MTLVMFGGGEQARPHLESRATAVKGSLEALWCRWLSGGPLDPAELRAFVGPPERLAEPRYDPGLAEVLPLFFAEIDPARAERALEVTSSRGVLPFEGFLRSLLGLWRRNAALDEVRARFGECIAAIHPNRTVALVALAYVYGLYVEALAPHALLEHTGSLLQRIAVPERVVDVQPVMDVLTALEELAALGRGLRVEPAARRGGPLDGGSAPGQGRRGGCESSTLTLTMRQPTVIIVTALKDEYDAVLAVETGASPGTHWERAPHPSISSELAHRTFLTSQGEPLDVLVTHALEKGGEALTRAIHPLVDLYKPRCVAMCGICAGRKDKVHLGDVILADLLWNHDAGKRVGDKHLGSVRSHSIDTDWKRPAESFQPNPESSWLLDHPDPSTPFRVHLGALATGNQVIRREGIFEELEVREHSTLGLEMEGSALGDLAHEKKIPYALVMKGVTDFADPNKGDRFRRFAARASAECLLDFLRRHPPLPATVQAPLPPEPFALKAALDEYKREQAKAPRFRHMDLRGMKGIAPGHHQTNLDLLDFAVAPFLTGASDVEDSEAAALRRHLQARDLEPALRREYDGKLERLDSSRWTPDFTRQGTPQPFAEILRASTQLVVIGDPGSGKSVFTRLVLLACMEGKVGQRARLLLRDGEAFSSKDDPLKALPELLPVYIAVGAHSNQTWVEGREPLESCLRHELARTSAPQILLDALDSLLSEGKLFVLLDGLDELPARRRKHVADAVTAFALKYTKVRLLVTSRPHGYYPPVAKLAYHRLAPLHPWQQRRLVARVHLLAEKSHQGDARSVERARRRTRALLDAIDMRPEWKELSGNPLLLTLSALTSSDTKGFPQHRIFIFENFLQTLLIQWRDGVTEQGPLLLEVWSTVALSMIRKEARRGVMKGKVCDLLKTALAGREALQAEEALRLALETGLVHEQEETIAFWHSSFAEFLVARALTSETVGAAKRILEEKHLTPLVVQLAAARLDHVRDAPEEVDALAEGLLARDTQGKARLYRPGLSLVSRCLADGVRLDPRLHERVWGQWAEVLASAMPTRFWVDFEALTQAVARPCLSRKLIQRFATLNDPAFIEVQLGLARIVARATTEEPLARETCTRWLTRARSDVLKRYGAYGLARAGDWSKRVIEHLVPSDGYLRLSTEELSDLVRKAPSGTHEQLQALVNPPPVPSSTQDEQQRNSLRFLAACLLALAGKWNADVATALKEILAQSSDTFSQDTAKTVVQHCAQQQPVQDSLLEWLGTKGPLGASALELVREVASQVEALPARLFSRASESASGRFRESLETSLAWTAEERPRFTEFLRHGLLDETNLAGQLCAARILLRMDAEEEQLHAAVHRGLSASDLETRVRWACLALKLGSRHIASAREVLREGARDSRQAIRQLLYEESENIHRLLSQQPLTAWLECARDPQVSPAARWDALVFVSRHSTEAPSTPLLRELVDAGDTTVAREAILVLSAIGPLDLEAAGFAAEDAARTGNAHGMLSVFLSGKQFFQETLPRFLLMTLDTARHEDGWMHQDNSCRWMEHIAAPASTMAGCVQTVLEGLREPGRVGLLAQELFRDMCRGPGLARDALRSNLGDTRNLSPIVLQRLVLIGLEHEATERLALEVLAGLDFQDSRSEDLSVLATKVGVREPMQAKRLWRLILDESDELPLLEACALLVQAGHEDAETWIRLALLQLMDSHVPVERWVAARLSFHVGVNESEARATLIECLDLTDSADGRSMSVVFWWIFSAEDEADPRLRHVSGATWSRLNFRAMYTLCHHCPEVGLRHLVGWLGAKEWHLFFFAVETLVAHPTYREKARAAIEQRLESAPLEEFNHLVHLIAQHGFYTEELASRVLARRPPQGQWSIDATQAVYAWMKSFPQTWAVIRRLQPAEANSYSFLLESRLPITRDAVCFALGYAIGHAALWANQGYCTLWRWCAPPPGHELHVITDEQTCSPSLDTVREWLREELLERTLPDRFSVLLDAERFACWSNLPRDFRIGLMRRALRLEADALDETDPPSRLVEMKALVSLRLFELSQREGSLEEVLKEAFHQSSTLSNETRFSLAKALMTFGPLEETVQQRLIAAAIQPVEWSFLEPELDVLRQTGLTDARIVEVLRARLRSHRLQHPTESFGIFDALVRHGCGTDLHGSLLLEFVSRCESDFLRENRLLQLARRADLSDRVAARLILQGLARPDLSKTDLVEEWLTRFTPREEEDSRAAHWPLSASSEGLESRMNLLERMALDVEPGWLHSILTEMADLPEDGFLTLYARAREDENSLSDAEWQQLSAWLSSHARDTDASRFAKEWLLLRIS